MILCKNHKIFDIFAEDSANETVSFIQNDGMAAHRNQHNLNILSKWKKLKIMQIRILDGCHYTCLCMNLTHIINEYKL